ncbi:MAG: hypothetical protein GX596_02020 [Propionibacterium sp.]|nr:hypothetical protein [Propionibacterium sp.]
MFSLQSLEIPIIAAPMAGGVTTPELVGAVGGAGGVGFVAGGYLSAEGLAHDMVAQSAKVLFGVNVFLPDDSPFSPKVDAALTTFREALAPLAEELGVEVGPAAHDRDDWTAKAELLVEKPVPVISCTFGTPNEQVVERWQGVGTCVMVTVTNADEAKRAAAAGVDGLIVQGPEAGGHRGTFTTAAVPGNTPLVELLAEVRSAVDLPMVAAGGLMTGAAIRGVLDAGAFAAQLGTAFLLTPEAGTAPAYRAALAERRYVETIPTRAFTGRFARSLANAFVERFHDVAPAAYPSVYSMTLPIRRAAAAAGDPDALALWAGTGWREAREAHAGDIVRDLWAEASKRR